MTERANWWIPGASSTKSASHAPSEPRQSSGMGNLLQRPAAAREPDDRGAFGSRPCTLRAGRHRDDGGYGRRADHTAGAAPSSGAVDRTDGDHAPRPPLLGSPELVSITRLVPGPHQLAVQVDVEPERTAPTADAHVHREQPGLVTVGNHVVKREVERHRQFLTVTLTLVVPLLPAASRTVAVTMWVPFVMPVVVHGTETGPEPETCVATCRPSTDSV